MSGATTMAERPRRHLVCTGKERVAYGSLLLLPGANGQTEDLLKFPPGERMPALGPAGPEKSDVTLTEQFTNSPGAGELGVSLGDFECLQVSIGLDQPFELFNGQALRISVHRNHTPIFSCEYQAWGTDNKPSLWPVGRERFERSDVVSVGVRTLNRPLIPVPMILSAKLIGYELAEQDETERERK